MSVPTNHPVYIYLMYWVALICRWLIPILNCLDPSSSTPPSSASTSPCCRSGRRARTMTTLQRTARISCRRLLFLVSSRQIPTPCPSTSSFSGIWCSPSWSALPSLGTVWSSGLSFVSIEMCLEQVKLFSFARSTKDEIYHKLVHL